MSHLEFLPPRYRQRRAARKNVVRKVVVLAGMAAVTASVALWQTAQERAARRELAQAAARDAVAQANQRRLAELQSELIHARAAAELCIFLRRPWPRARILATVINALPMDVELAELRIAYEEAAPDRPAPGAGSQKKRSAARKDAESVPPAVQDLQQLTTDFGRAQTVVHLSGAALDSLAIHRFIAHLSHDPLVARAELGSLEIGGSSERGAATQFTARIVMRDAFSAPTEAAPTRRDTAGLRPAARQVGATVRERSLP
jgi:hypothetical protein